MTTQTWNINIGMSNFEVVEARKNGVPFTEFEEKCGWSLNNVKLRMISARNGREWQYGEEPDAIKETEERFTSRMCLNF